VSKFRTVSKKGAGQYFALTISVAGAMSGIALAPNGTDPNQSNPRESELLPFQQL
jgi:hypothetical protein